MPVQMPHFMTLLKDGVPYRVPLYNYVEGQGGRLVEASTLRKLQVVALERMYEGEADFIPMVFGPDGLSRDLFQPNTTIKVSGQGEESLW